MMRYQRVSPDCLALPNGRKPSSISATYPSSFDSKPIKVRSGSGSENPTTQTQQDTIYHLPHFPSTSENSNHEISGNGRCSTTTTTTTTGDVLLQWGHKKRSRGSRAENPNRTVGDESSAVQSRQMIKIQRRAAISGAEKIAAVAADESAAMPPPRGATLRAFTTGPHHNSNRNVEDRSGGQSRSDKRSPPSPPIKPHNNHHHHHHNHKTTPSANGFRSDAPASMNAGESKASPSDQETRGSSGGPSAAAVEKVNLEHFEWPKIYFSLSRKEKEDDFLAMKGTKLPQRPKKRAKNVDKTLQYCFPGMWLSDLTRGRYEVREKKCVKKKWRGLKGMESMDSDSE